jgi:hypothetical protein
MKIDLKQPRNQAAAIMLTIIFSIIIVVTILTKGFVIFLGGAITVLYGIVLMLFYALETNKWPWSK